MVIAHFPDGRHARRAMRDLRVTMPGLTASVLKEPKPQQHKVAMSHSRARKGMWLGLFGGTLGGALLGGLVLWPLAFSNLPMASGVLIGGLGGGLMAGLAGALAGANSPAESISHALEQSDEEEVIIALSVDQEGLNMAQKIATQHGAMRVVQR